MKKKLLPLLGMLAICEVGHSQTIAFSYDAAGNRIKREAKTNVTRSISDDYAEDQEEGIGEKNVTVTEKGGRITILIKELDPDTPYEVGLYTPNAIQLYSKTIDSNTTIVSLSEYPAGTYILTLKHNEETTTYKFAKK